MPRMLREGFKKRRGAICLWLLRCRGKFCWGKSFMCLLFCKSGQCLFFFKTGDWWSADGNICMNDNNNFSFFAWMLSFRAQIELQVQEGARASFGRGNLTSISGMKRKEERVNFHPRADDDLFRDVTWEEVSNGCLWETYPLHPFVAFGITTKKK